MTAVANEGARAESEAQETGPAPAMPLKGLSGLFFLLSTQKILVAIAAVSAMFGVALGLVPFFCVARMATAIYAAPPRLDEVRDLAVVAVAAVALRYVFASLSNVVAHVAAFRLLHDIRVRFTKKLGGVPLSFFATRTAGELKRTMMDDVNQIEAFVAHHFPDAVSAIAVPLLTVAALLTLDWRMALASVITAPLALLSMAVAMRGLGEAHRRWLTLQDRTNNALLEYFRGIHVIKTFGLTAKSFGDLSRSIEEALTWMTDFMKTNGRGYGTFSALLGSSLVALIPMGGYLHLRGSLSLENLVLFLVLGPQLLTSMKRLMFAHGNVQRIEEGNARIANVLLAEDLVSGAGRTAPNDDSIAFYDVGFGYGPGKDVLHGITFEARAGQVTALVGPSGAGKTTLARIAARLWDPTSGRVEVGGVDSREQPLDALLGRMSIVFQEVFLFYGTVRENLLMAKPDATDEELHRACRASRAHDFIEKLPRGYDTMLGERGARLSGGEKQRLSIARAVLKDAPILILDEATAFADAENEALIQEALSALAQGRTVLVIAHRLSTIASADRIVVLERGRIVDQGTHDALVARCDLYGSLWHHHTGALDWEMAS